MKKRGVFFLGLVILMSVFVLSGPSSETQAIINIIGCVDDGAYVPVGECSANGDNFCEAHLTLKNVFKIKDACLQGVSGTPDPNKICCPDGGSYRCVEESAGAGYYCVRATEDCGDFLDESTCVNNLGQCFWNGECVPKKNNCYGYTNMSLGSFATQKELCEADPQGVASSDINCRYGETESGGIPYVISQESCECAWGDLDGDPNTGDSSGNECGLSYNITTSFGDGSKTSKCIYSLYDLGDDSCTDGFVEYTYNASFSSGDLPGLAEGDARCTDRKGRRRCGESIVKVPFFGMFNFVVIGLMLFLTYFYRNRIKFFGYDA